MSDLPTLCLSCLGDKAHVKMVRQPSGEQCKLCTRPFTVFRWNVRNEDKKLKKTIICGTCALARNCCQSCMLDIDYGIPLEIRDAALKMAGVENDYAIELSSRNNEVRAIMADKLEAKNALREKASAEAKRAKARTILEALLAKLASKKSLPREKSAEVSSKEVSKVVSKLPFGGTLAVPTDTSIKSFFVFGFTLDMPQYAVSSYFETFGPLSLVKIIHRARCGFVTFTTRTAAEACAEAISRTGLSANTSTAGLVLLEKKHSVRVSWGAPRPLGTTNDEQNKVGLVVANVMKQLADKDQQRTEKPKKEKKKVELQPKAQYKAAAKDFEL